MTFEITFEKQCVLIYKVDSFVRNKLLQSRYRVLQAVGAFGINFLMGFCYATVLQIGERESKKRRKKQYGK